jgi:hypothetical protein
MLVKTGIKMYYENWVLACSKLFRISSQFISLHVLQILIPYSCQSSFLELLSWSVNMVFTLLDISSLEVASPWYVWRLHHCLVFRLELTWWLVIVCCWYDWIGLCVEDSWSYFGIMNPHGSMYFWQTFLSSVFALVHVEDPYHHGFMVVE